MRLTADYTRLQLRNGNKANIVNNDGIQGEPLYTTDTKQFYIHDGNEYLPVPTAQRIIINNDELITASDELVWI